MAAAGNDRKQALKMALSQIERQFGKGSVMRLGDNTERRDIETVSTGSLALDVALGIGGLPRGRVVEIYGPRVIRENHFDFANHCSLSASGRLGGIY